MNQFLQISWKNQQLYQEICQQKPQYGSRGKKHYELVRGIIRKYKIKRIFDFGCGKHYTLLTKIIEKHNVIARGYDVCFRDCEQNDIIKNIIDIDFAPDLIISTDCLEHIPEEELPICWDLFRKLNAKLLFLIVSTRKAGIILPNGANAHATVKSGEWWESVLLQEFFKYKLLFLNREESLFIHEAKFLCIDKKYV